MKTVLVLTLLAVTIACCYAQPADSETAEHSKRPEHPSK